MGLFDFFKRRRKDRRDGTKALVTGGSVPSTTRTRHPTNWMFWRRGDYTLVNSELLFSAVSRIANALSAMPVHLYKDSTVAKDHPLNDLISVAPNVHMTSCTWLKTMEACRDTSGNAYALKVYSGPGKLEGLAVLDPTKVQPVLEQDSGELWYRINPAPERGEEFLVHSFHMVHIPFISTNGVCGVNPVSVLFDTINYNDQIQKFSLEQLKKGVNSAVVLEAPTNLGEQQRDDVVEDFVATYKKTAGKILLLESGMKASVLNLSPVDSELFDVEKISRSKVAMVFNLPPHLLGDYSEQSYNSQEQQMLEFLQLTMLPIVTAYEQELNRKLLTSAERAEGYHFRFSMDAILRADAATQAEVNYKDIRSGTRTPDEIRAQRGDPPLPNGIGSVAMISQDLAPLEYTVNEKPKVLAAKLERGQGGEEPPDE